MEPYTVSGMALPRSCLLRVGENGEKYRSRRWRISTEKVALTENYELVGVIVHRAGACGPLLLPSSRIGR